MWAGCETNTGYEDGSTWDAQKWRTHWASLTFALVPESDSPSRAGREVGSPALGGLQKSWGKCLASCHLRTSPFSFPSQCPRLQGPLTCWSQWSLPSITWVLPVPNLLTNVNLANVWICWTKLYGSNMPYLKCLELTVFQILNFYFEISAYL